jgi:hypothetical protein
MFLKVLTTALVVCGFAMVLAIPFMLGQKPEGGDQLELARFGARVLLFFGLTCIVWIAAAVCAIVLARRARTEFLQDQGENIKSLIEGTLHDHGRKQ